MVCDEDSLANFNMGSMEMLTGILMCEIVVGGMDSISTFSISGMGAEILHCVKKSTTKSSPRMCKKLGFMVLMKICAKIQATICYF